VWPRRPAGILLSVDAVSSLATRITTLFADRFGITAVASTPHLWFWIDGPSVRAVHTALTESGLHYVNTSGIGPLVVDTGAAVQLNRRLRARTLVLATLRDARAGRAVPISPGTAPRAGDSVERYALALIRDLDLSPWPTDPADEIAAALILDAGWFATRGEFASSAFAAAGSVLRRLHPEHPDRVLVAAARRLARPGPAA
jgi:hypothetical protein